MASGDYTKATRKMKKMKSGRTVSPRYSHVDGPQAAVDSMAHHLTTIYSGSLINNDRPAPITTATTTTIAPPFTADEVLEQLLQLPRSKAPGIDSITTEILRPISDLVSPLISTLFTICWNWGYTPEAWRTAQVISIYKKGTATDPANYRPISLTSIFRKVMEKCIHGVLLAHSPPLDVAQGGFRAQRSALDQALCLAQICHIYTKINKAPPVLAFLDIKSAYDTAPAFSPATGVLQGSILSPLLYSIYINSLPQLLRTSPLSLPTTPPELLTSYTCLLYADDVALIGDQRTILTNLQLCEQHSFDVGYRWSPTKCVILEPAPSPSSFQLYNTSIPCHDHFTYLGIPFKTGGEIGRDRLLQHNTQKMLASMNVMASLGLNNSGFTKLLSSRIYQQFLRPQMEYGLAITPLTKTLVTKKLEQAQNDSIRRFYGAHSLSSTVIMRHLARIPSMQARVDLLRFKYLHRIATLPADSLLSIIIAVSTSAPRRFTATSPWIRLSNHPLWRQHKSMDDPPPTQRFLNAHLDTLHTAASRQSTLLQQCRPKRGIDPILHVPMDRRHRSRLIRWRLGWLTGGFPRLCACGHLSWRVTWNNHKTEASNIVCDKHHGYFKCVGMNNVFDATDHPDGSQLALFDEKQRKVILARILSPPIEHQSTFNKELNGLAQLVQSSKDEKLALNLMHNYASKAKVADQITAQMHIHTLQLLLWSPELFDVNTLSNLSEGDYVVKFWGPLVELVFCKTGLRPQWGDTVSQLGKKTKPRMKMDLRVLCVASRNNDEQDDVCSGEFAKASGGWKYHKDKAKLVVNAKLLLNQVIKELGSDNANNTRICMLQSMGLEAAIYSLRLVANGLYVLESHGTLKIPTCIEQYAKSMAELLEKLNLLKELSLKMKSHCELARNKKYQLKTGLSRFTSSSKFTPTVNWIRNIWHNPSLENDDDDDE
ncbi:hypothetical protein [Absidia glauca]|uniref:Reverse transcriptase domain-containing protein n=1 Tax=Absidia glauca TaxID=4829 RepID=A0A163J0W7_ABSGL|nr:hypothetical protein [Absidia glauca]